jgi:NTE family protein
MAAIELKRIGLALSGAVGRAAAYVGVLSVLEREDIPIDCVSGSSAGALIGAAYCAGIEIERLRQIALNVRWWDIATLTWPRRGFVSFERLEHWLIGLIGDLTFAQLKRPLAVVATDLESGSPVVIKEGRVAPAVRASCSVPGIVVPVELNGRVLGDGSVSYNLPVAPLYEMGAKYTIGVDLFTPSFNWGWGPLGVGLTAVEILVRQSNAGLCAPDCLIVPEIAGFNYLRLSKGAELMARAERATEAQLPAIRQALFSTQDFVDEYGQ